ncbi:hypothetical protein ACHAXT_007771 [Thalassiosira profunda]
MGEDSSSAPNPNGFPSHGYNAQNPPTNLWSTQPAAAIPDNVVITTNGDVGSVASALSMPKPPVASSGALQAQQQQVQPNQNRAIHRINLASIRHNYNEVQSSASKQQCQVIVVVKADGYGHGAILTACHLVERCGAVAFAVATLEEGISLRRAFEERFPDPPRTRILVLGAPVGYPECFDSYLHNHIELMVSGPEVAASLAQWMKNHDGRRRAEVESMAERRKEELLDEAVVLGGNIRHPMKHGVVRQVSTGRDATNKELLKEKQAAAATKKDESDDAKDATTCNTTVTSDGADAKESSNVQETQNASNGGDSSPQPVSPSRLQKKYNAATLTNVTGDDLAREVREILIGQRHATAKATLAAIPEPPTPGRESFVDSETEATAKEPQMENAPAKPAAETATKQPVKKMEGEALFCGIDDAARASRQQELRAIRRSELEDELGVYPVEALEDEAPQMRKKLRWHALVDSGMGRLGFKTDTEEQSDGARKPDPQARLAPLVATEDALSDGSISSSDCSAGMRDTVSIIKDLYEAEVHEGAPIEFYGMCTHMAEANSTSTYTNDQMQRFRSLLHRVRSAGVSVPTISTDNSAALLTTTLTHFDPDAILSHDTRGFVRCGGAIYGQRPAFRQLRAVSTLSATVKHVAIIKQGESVGYDRAYVAPLDVRIGTLTVGFADGYPRELGNGVGRVSIRGSTYPVAGNVCMDMLMVDLGPADVPSPVTVGDTAVLWGPEDANVEECGNGLVPLAELATTLKTTQSALTCGLDKLRVQRQLVG